MRLQMKCCHHSLIVCSTFVFRAVTTFLQLKFNCFKHLQKARCGPRALT